MALINSKIVIACDSMKGSLTSSEVALAARRGIMDICRDADVVSVPMADGGEGTSSIVTKALGGHRVQATVIDPLRREVIAEYGVVSSAGQDVALIDVASAAGLTLLSEHERNPLVTTTFGVGQLMLHAWNNGCRRFVIGLGGSATNDGGKGMLEALGVRFLDSEGRVLSDGGASLINLSRVDISLANRQILSADITVMCDVDNPLTGSNGASAVYGPQKGATPVMVSLLDSALCRYADVVAVATSRYIAELPGAGAAGGLGAAFLAFTDAHLQPGVEVLMDIIGFDDIISDADLVITGEGRIDRQTLSGKLPCGVLRRCQKKGIPVVAIAGAVADRELLLQAGFAGVYCINPAGVSRNEAMRPEIAAANTRQCCAEIARLLK